jgi:hypothetical protein
MPERIKTLMGEEGRCPPAVSPPAANWRSGAAGNSRPPAVHVGCGAGLPDPAPHRHDPLWGEAQRIRLATQIGSGLTGVLYVLDEPSIGLHQRDNDRLLNTLTRLRDLGNTLIVVEHDEDTIRAADPPGGYWSRGRHPWRQHRCPGQLKDLLIKAKPLSPGPTCPGGAASPPQQNGDLAMAAA